MKIRQLIVMGFAVASAGAAHAITVLSEGFNSVAALSGAGWTQVNNSTAPAGASWFQGNTGIFTAAAGAADSYAAANFLSTGNSTGAVSNWLILPTLTLDSTSTVSFMVRTAGEGFLDKIEVRLSTSGASANVGSTTTSVGDFTILLGSYASDTASGWNTLSFATGFLASPTSSRLAIRYVVDNVATAGNYVGIDSLTVTAVPEPATYALFALGLAGAALRRRLHNAA